MLKTVCLVDVLGEVLEPFTHRIDWAFVYGSIARSEELASSDVDLMIIGRVGLADIVPALRQAEKRLNRPVNPTVYSREAFATKLAAGQAFVHTVLHGAKLFIIGEAIALVASISVLDGS